MERLITEQELRAKTAEKRKLILFFVAVSVVFAGVVLTFLFVSTRGNYIFFMIADIALTVGYGWFALYFFTIIFRKTACECVLLKKLSHGESFTERVRIISADGRRERDGVDFDVISCEAEDGAREILTLAGRGQFEPGQRVTFTVCANVATAYEAEEACDERKV